MLFHMDNGIMVSHADGCDFGEYTVVPILFTVPLKLVTKQDTRLQFRFSRCCNMTSEVPCSHLTMC